MPALPREFTVTLWGDPLEAVEQYRYGKVYIREFQGRWLARMNQFDPDNGSDFQTSSSGGTATGIGDVLFRTKYNLW